MTYGYAIGACLHAIFVTASLIGVLLFLRAAWNMKAVELMQWAKWLLIIGILGSLLTGGLGGFGWKGMRGQKMMWQDGKMMDMKNMNEMMDKDTGMMGN